MCSQLRKQAQRNHCRTIISNSPFSNAEYHTLEDTVKLPSEILREAKKDIKMLTKQVRALEKEK